MRLMLLAAAAAVSLSPAPSPETWGERPVKRFAKDCRDRITQVREATGQPHLERSPAVSGQDFLIAAVDKRVDGCAVMQMHRRIDDLRPLPESSSQPAKLIPLR